MKRLVSPAALAAGVMVFGAYALDARADTITYTQNIADFTSLPGVLSIPAPVTTTGSVYAPIAGGNGALGVVTIGSVDNIYRSPFENEFSGNGAVQASNGGWQLPGYAALAYSSIQANSSATYNTGLANTLSILWGSPDYYNTLTFWSGTDGTGTNLGSLSVTTEIGGVSGSLPLGIQTYGHDQMTFTDVDGTFLSVVLSSSVNAFEFANLTFGLNQNGLGAPLPAAFPLFAGGLGVIGLLARRRNRKKAAPVCA